VICTDELVGARRLRFDKGFLCRSLITNVNSSGSDGKLADWLSLARVQGTAVSRGAPCFELRSSRSVRQKAEPPLRMNEGNGVVTTR
jgi:hypothetical protein